MSFAVPLPTRIWAGETVEGLRDIAPEKLIFLVIIFRFERLPGVSHDDDLFENEVMLI
jgi:hypothetical protein